MPAWQYSTCKNVKKCSLRFKFRNQTNFVISVHFWWRFSKREPISKPFSYWLLKSIKMYIAEQGPFGVQLFVSHKLSRNPVWYRNLTKLLQWNSINRETLIAQWYSCPLHWFCILKSHDNTKSWYHKLTNWSHRFCV